MSQLLIQQTDLSKTAIDTNPVAVYLMRLTPKSRRVQGEALEKIARLTTGQTAIEFTWHQLRYRHTAAIRAKLQEDYAPATANRMLSALRSVLGEAWRLGLMTAEDYHQAADVKNIKSQQLPTGRSIAADEQAALMQTCLEDESPAGMRDAALLGILRSGLRRFEVVGLDLSDLDLTESSCKVRSGKGRKDRQVYLTDEAIGSLQRWLELRGAQPGPLFLPINKAGHMTQRRMSDESVRTILIKRVGQAELEAHTPHDWRRTFASDLLDAGADLSTVQQLMGHSNPSTTARYDRRGEATKRKAVKMLS
ncbi:tyrosine-type recombinase/integrase [Phormidium tenue FACHB-886]|nr:tyrosine-type recombinase/integrase [Phormidium tenue FACHB-886]